jgi:hypothetical protein
MTLGHELERDSDWKPDKPQEVQPREPPTIPPPSPPSPAPAKAAESPDAPQAATSKQPPKPPAAVDRYAGPSLPEMTPATAEEVTSERTEAAEQSFVRSAKVAGASMEMPPAENTLDWGTRKEGQSEPARRQEVYQIAQRRRSAKQAEQDTEALTGEQPPQKPKEAPPLPPQQPPAGQRVTEAGQRQQRRGEAWQRQQRQGPDVPQTFDDKRAAVQQRAFERDEEDGFPHQRLPFPEAPGHDAIPPRENRDTDQVPLDTFGRATVGYANAVYRKMAELSKLLVDLTCRVDQIETKV